MKIAVAGTGYVGLSLATLLAQKNHVTAVDVVKEKVDLINNRKSPIQDDYIEQYLAEKELDLTATLDGEKAYSDADFIVIAAPTNYDSKKNFFDTSHVEEVIDLVLKVNPDAIMVIKSTIPVGYTESVREKFSYRERLQDGTMKVVVVAANTRIQANAVNYGTGVKAFHFGIGIKLVKETDAQGKVGVGKQLYCLGLGCSHVKGIYILLDGSLLQQVCKCVGSLFKARHFFVKSNYDS